MNRLALENFTLQYRNTTEQEVNKLAKWQLGPLNCIINKGEHVGIIGGSGSGKSSLLHAIQHYGKFQKEDIEYSGLLTRPSDKIFTVLQEPKAVLNPMRTVYALFRSLSYTTHNIPSLNKAKIQEYLSAVGLHEAHILGYRARNLSGGMAQRLMLALILALDAQWILADEVSSSLDEYHEQKIMELIQEHIPTYILVTHRISHITKYCNRVIFLDKGQIVYDGVFDGLLSSTNAAIQLYLKNIFISHTIT